MTQVAVVEFEALLLPTGYRATLEQEARSRHGVSADNSMPADPTVLEIVALDVAQRYSRWLRDGAAVLEQIDDRLNALAHNGSRRLILRADARRRDVIPFLERANLHDRFAMVRCADDPPIAGSIYRSSIGRSWEAIIDRVTRWGVDAHTMEIVGANDQSKMVAQRVVSGDFAEDWGY